MALRKFIIERDIPEVGTFEREQLRGAAATSNCAAFLPWRRHRTAQTMDGVRSPG